MFVMTMSMRVGAMAASIPASAPVEQTAAQKADEAFRLSTTFLNTKLDNTPQQEEFLKQLGAIITIWLVEAEDFQFTIDEKTFKIFDNSTTLMVAYEAAQIIYCHNHGLNKTTGESFIGAMKLMVKYYDENKAVLGKNKTLQKWSAMSPEKLYKELEKAAPKD